MAGAGLGSDFSTEGFSGTFSSDGTAGSSFTRTSPASSVFSIFQAGRVGATRSAGLPSGASSASLTDTSASFCSAGAIVVTSSTVVWAFAAGASGSELQPACTRSMLITPICSANTAVIATDFFICFPLILPSIFNIILNSSNTKLHFGKISLYPRTPRTFRSLKIRG